MRWLRDAGRFDATAILLGRSEVQQLRGARHSLLAFLGLARDSHRPNLGALLMVGGVIFLAMGYTPDQMAGPPTVGIAEPPPWDLSHRGVIGPRFAP